MDKEASQKLFNDVFFKVPMGLFIINGKEEICAWNDWMKQASDITEEKAIGKTLKELFPDENYARYDWAIEQVLKYSNPQYMSQALNHYLIPIHLKDDMGYGLLSMMQQKIELHPIKNNGSTYALVVIQDVTMASHQQNTLLNMAKRFEEDSLYDELTGIYNRRYIDTWFNTGMKNALYDTQLIVCSLFDLDHFKEVNDVHGHKAGDDVLLSFVKVVQSTLRDKDLFARYGGEEFVVFSVINTTDNPAAIGERTRERLEKVTSHGAINLKVTCSVGVSTWSPKEPELTAQALIDKADVLLYQAKNSGRNRVCFETKVKA